MKRPFQEPILLLVLAQCFFFSSCGERDNSSAEEEDVSTSLNEEAPSINLEEKSEDSLEKKPAKKSPSAPFTTSTLQQEASRKLYFSVSKTMTMAQRLYEAGLITYMRTDSVNLSNEAKQGAAKEIVDAYGKEYAKERNNKGKSKGAQEAHEAIRTTNFSVQSAGLDYDQTRLYELLWKRAIATQISETKL